MIITYIHRIGWFIGLVLLQVLILNSVHIAGYATPFLYIYFILKFSSGTSRNELMLWAFFFGLTIDIFSDTPGMNAAATVLVAFLRPTFLRLFVPRDTLDTLVPAVRTMGISSEIFGCQCLGTSRDAAYPRILLLCPHRHVVVENCNKRFADCNLYNGGRGYTEEVKRDCLVMCIRIYNS